MDSLKKLTWFVAVSPKKKVIFHEKDASIADILEELEVEELEEDFGILEAASKKHCLPGLSDTRWGSRLSSLRVLLTKYKIIHETLLSTMEESRGYTRTNAAGLAKIMEHFQFVIVAVITQYIIGFVKPLSLDFQKSSCDLVQVQAEASRTKAVISKQRTETVFSGLYKRAVAIAEEANVTPEQPRSTSSSRQQHRANAEADTVEEYLRRNLFYPFVDHMTSEIERRFPN